MDISVTGLLIAGGKSSRMGVDKATYIFKGRMLAQWCIDILKAVSNNIIISANNDLLLKLGFTVISDKVHDAGPMAGLIAGLEYSTSTINAVIACDTPFVSPLVYLKLIKEMGDAPLIMAVNEANQVQPLIACYKKTVVNEINAQLLTGNKSLRSLTQINGCKLVSFPNDMLSVNINTLDDIAQITNLK